MCCSNLKYCMTWYTQRPVLAPLTKKPRQQLLLLHLDSLLHLKKIYRICKWDGQPSLWALQTFSVTVPNSDRRVEWLIPSKKVAKLEVIWDDESIQRLHTNADSSCTSHTCSNKGLVRIVFLLPLWVCTLSLTVPLGPLDTGMMPFHVAEMSWPKTAFKNSCSGLSYSQGDVMWWDVLPFDCALKKRTEVTNITLTQLNQENDTGCFESDSHKDLLKVLQLFPQQTGFQVQLQNVKTMWLFWIGWNHL